MAAKNYRFKCRNHKCGYEALRRMNTKDFNELIELGDANNSGIRCFQCSFPRMEIQNSKLSVRDKFEPGFNRTFKKYVGSEQEFNKLLKEHGLINYGYEDLPEQEKVEKNYYDNEAILKKLSKAGFSGNQIKALKEGKKLSNPKQLEENLKKMDEYAKNEI